MPEPLTSYVDAWRAKYYSIGPDLWMLGNSLKGAAIYIGQQNWNYAAMYIDSAGDDAHIISRHFSVDADSIYYAMYDTLHWIDENIGGAAVEYELTMDKILEAMWDTDKLRSFHFINYIDAMRASIWNVEIYETHLADWYRHFSL